MKTMINQNSESKKPWYKEPYVWLVIIFPLIAVIGGLTTAWIAVETDDGLVVDDYYKRGLEINQDLDRDKAAEGYDLTANLMLDQSRGTLKIILAGNETFSLPDSIKLSFINATRKGYDKSLLVERNPENEYTAVAPPLIKGKWYVLIESGNWRKFITYYTR